ncbi:MAG: leucyl aminopeptidase [Gammaproteobacteria bacterium]|jgi:leucyl aminopeptidase
MDYLVKTIPAENEQADALVLPVYSDEDKLANPHLNKILKTGDMTGKFKQTLLLHDVPGIKAKRVLLIGCGKKDELTEAKYQDLVTQMIASLQQTNAKDILCLLPEVICKKRSLPWKIRHTIIHVNAALYQFNDFKSKKDNNDKTFKSFTFVTPKADLEHAKQAIKEGVAIAHAMNNAKDLENTPANICNPKYIAKAASDFAKKHKTVKCTVLGEKEMAKLGMGALLAVGQGSDNESQLIVLEYNGGKKSQKPIVLVGKGITFDTGGINLKPSTGINGMKYDMCGAASVFGALQVAVALKLPLNIVMVIASAENMPDGHATRPDDIIKTMAGLTVEIGNTDAEGRLVLCDALTYCERFKPECVVDVATLTGAVIVALGNQASGLLSNHQALADDLLKAGNETFDRAWQLPLWPEYQEGLDSQFADMNNVGGEAGTIIGASFLARFTEKFHWAHLDIAGTAHVRQKKAYATGRPVPLLSQFLIDKAK